MEPTEPPKPRPPVSIGVWVARAVAVVLLVPVRLIWEALNLCGRAIVAAGIFFRDKLLVPACRFVRNWMVRPLWLFLKDVLWGWALHHVLWGLVLEPLAGLVRKWVLRPVLYAIEVTAGWFWRWLLRPVLYAIEAAAGWFWRWLLHPALHAVAVAGRWSWQWCVVRPLRIVQRWLVRPCRILLVAVVGYGRRVAAALVRVLVVTPCAFAYRRVLRPALRALVAAGEVVVVRPIAWVHRRVVVPMNRFVADLWNAVFGR
ncbi:hypothetical protein IU448_09985 [Nocardia flavorosea]|uniref:hypothetical protein n=1 Tax=Nocardia flavorosea TaxID=53429 RepID=UPI00189472FA|nr:hypothetical protein [Nocardia flavorosea]MBF6349351.1 hypothetical protein [Nocardia flavorosea]